MGKSQSKREEKSGPGRSKEPRGRARKARVVDLGSQVGPLKGKLTWADLWRLELFRISFLLRAVYDTLPTLVNLHR